MVQTGWAMSLSNNASQQSVHLTLGILRQSQAVFYALPFFWLDGFAVPHPSAGNANRWQELRVKTFCGFQNWLVFQISV